MFVQPDIDYLWCLQFGYCTGKRTEQMVVSEEINLFRNLKGL